MTPLAPLQTFRRLPPEDKAIALALAVIVERIQSLPKPDRDDLFELIQGLRKRNTDEEVEDIVNTMEEILAQSPARIGDLGLARQSKTTEGLKKWKQFVASNLRKLRQKAGLTQIELAEKANLPQSHVSRLESAQYSATHATIQKLAKALGVPASTLDPSAED